MKKIALLPLAGVFVGLVVADELVITSFNRNGELTWTNSVSNATYRVEWASSASGLWNTFDALTNLTLLSATSNLVTVKVPMFYRVAWLDAPKPEPAGEWLFNGFNEMNELVVTGRLSLHWETNQTDGQGLWTFARTDGSTNLMTYPSGEDGFDASLVGYDFTVQLALPPFAEPVGFLEGKMIGDAYTGTWFDCGIVCNRIGRFECHKAPAVKGLLKEEQPTQGANRREALAGQCE